MNSTLLFATYKYRGTHLGPCGLSDLKLQSSWLLELLICYKLSLVHLQKYILSNDLF